MVELDRLFTRAPKPPEAAAVGAGEAGAGEFRAWGGFDTPAPKPASTLFMAFWGAVVTVMEEVLEVGEAGKASLGLSVIEGKVRIGRRAAREREQSERNAENKVVEN